MSREAPIGSISATSLTLKGWSWLELPAAEYMLLGEKSNGNLLNMIHVRGVSLVCLKKRQPDFEEGEISQRQSRQNLPKQSRALSPRITVSPGANDQVANARFGALISQRTPISRQLLITAPRITSRLCSPRAGKLLEPAYLLRRFKRTKATLFSTRRASDRQTAL